MKVTHTSLFILKATKKNVSSTSSAKELIKNESVMVEEAESNELPQYISLSR